MSIVLNAFPLKVSELEVKVCEIPYSKEILDEFRISHRKTHTFHRKGNNILIFSMDGTFPNFGVPLTISLKDNIGIFCSLVKAGLTRHLNELGRNPSGFNPIELISIKPKDNLLAPILGETYPFKICTKYSIDTRIIQGQPCLVIDCTTRKVIKENCLYFLNSGFDLIGRYVVSEQKDGYKKFLGMIGGVTGEIISVTRPDGHVVQTNARDIFLEANLTNFDDFILHTNGTQKDAIVERIRQSISLFNGGDNKKKHIDQLKGYIQSNTIPLINGIDIEIEDSPDIQKYCGQMQKPIFVFNDNGQADWVEKGLTRYGPYTKRTFDRNDPSICVICAQHDKGRVEQFVRKFLKGIPNSKYFNNGLEGKFTLGTSRVEVFTTASENLDGFKRAIEAAIQKKAEDGGR